MRVRNDDRFAGGSGASVETDDLLHRRGAHSVGISVAQIRLYNEGELADIGDRANIVRIDLVLGKKVAVPFDVFVSSSEDLDEFFVLNGS